MSAQHLLKTLLKGLHVQPEGREGRVIDLVVSADQQHKGLCRRVLQHVAHAPFRAGSLCYAGYQHGAVRVVALQVRAAPVDDGLPDGAHLHIAQLWPAQAADGEAHDQALVAHQGVEGHQHSRPAVDDLAWLRWEGGADDAHAFAPVDVTALQGLDVQVWHDPAAAQPANDPLMVAGPVLYHVMGPQGVGKTLIAEALVRDARARGVKASFAHEELAYNTTADATRTWALACGVSLVVIESTEWRKELHDNPAPDDLFISLQRGGAQ